MAATIRHEFGADVELIEGEKGAFDVVVDGELVFSKHSQGRFPEEHEIVGKLRKR